MDSIINAFSQVAIAFGQWLAPHLYNISLLLVVCLISLYANDMIKITKRFVVRQHFIIRVACFVLVTGFGFGLMVVFVTPFLSQLLMMLGIKWLGVTVLVAFIVLGVIADKKSQL